jgi:hypothetical protein
MQLRKQAGGRGDAKVRPEAAGFHRFSQIGTEQYSDFDLVSVLSGL